MLRPEDVNPDYGTWESGEFEEVSTGIDHYSVEPKYLINALYFTEIMKGIEGRMLTVADASTEDEKKREAIKSLIRNAIWQKVREVRLLRLKKV